MQPCSEQSPCFACPLPFAGSAAARIMSAIVTPLAGCSTHRRRAGSLEELPSAQPPTRVQEPLTLHVERSSGSRPSRRCVELSQTSHVKPLWIQGDQPPSKDLLWCGHEKTLPGLSCLLNLRSGCAGLSNSKRWESRFHRDP